MPQHGLGSIPAQYPSPLLSSTVTASVTSLGGLYTSERPSNIKQALSVASPHTVLLSTQHQVSLDLLACRHLCYAIIGCTWFYWNFPVSFGGIGGRAFAPSWKAPVPPWKLSNVHYNCMVSLKGGKHLPPLWNFLNEALVCIYIYKCNSTVEWMP